jgi:uncharacterized protein (TIRG00374 family)
MKILRGVCVLLACAALLAFAFRDVDLARVAIGVRSARPRFLLAALLLDGLVFLAKSLKWRLVCLPVRRLPTSAFFAGIAVGALAANVLPFRLDELARSAYFGRRHGIPKAAVLGTIVVERLVDGAALLLAVAVLLVAFEPRGWLLRGATLVLAGLALGASLTFALVVSRRRLLPLLARLVTGRAVRTRARILQALEHLGQGLAAFPRTERLAGVFACAAGEWLCSVACVMLTLHAFGRAIPLAGYLLLVVASYLSFGLPAVPGALGVFETLVKTSLVAGFALEPATALGYALTLHLMLVAPISVIGAVVLAREGWSLGDLGRLSAGAIATEQTTDAHAAR